jgi:prephenate dehydrogenase
MRLANQQATHSPTLFDLAAGSFASATRVAHSDPALWRDICHDNRVALTEALRQFEAELAQVRTLLSDADAFEAYLRGNAPD